GQAIRQSDSRRERLLRTGRRIISPAVAIEPVARRSDRPTQAADGLSFQVLISETQSASGIRAIKPEHLVVGDLSRYGAVIPAQTEIQREPIGCLEVILHKRCQICEVILIQISGHASRTERTRLESAGVVVVAEEEISDRISCSAE